MKSGRISGWNYLMEFDLTPFLRCGENTLKIIARDSGMLPCGVLAEIQVDGQPVIPTDASWRDANGKPVCIVAPYGAGAWGSQVKQEKGDK